MSINQGTNGSYGYKAKDIIFSEAQNINSINILAKGKVDVYISSMEEQQCLAENQLISKSYKLFSIDQNIFLGANDLFLTMKHSLSYAAATDSVIFSYFVENMQDIEELLKQKADYSTYILNSINTIIENSYQSLNKLEQLIKSLSMTADNLCLYFWILKDKHKFTHEPVHAAFRDSMFKLQEMKEEKAVLPFNFDPSFLESTHFEYDYFPSEEIDSLKMAYYKHLCDMNPDLKKEFLNESFIVAQYSCTDSALLLESILFKIKEAFKIAENYAELLYSSQKSCIFEEFFAAATQLSGSLYDPMDMVEVLQYMAARIKAVVETFKTEYQHELPIDMNSLEERVGQLVNSLMLKTPLSTAAIAVQMVREGMPEELENSAQKILAYSGLPQDRCDIFLNALNAFRGLKDKLSDEDQVRNLRKDITNLYFEVYEAVLKRVTSDNDEDRLIRLFLTYGFMDEKLLSPQHLWTLYDISEKEADSRQDSIHSIKNWLQLIYKKEKDPSVNSFSMDYFDAFRELKKQGEVTDKDKAAYDNNADGRLSFEITNMFKHNHRLCNRQVSTYFPILYDEVIVKELDKALVTPEKIKEAVQKVLDIDYSAFHREISYFNMKKRIEKEMIMQAVMPDIILMPAYGDNAIMWQEISGRVRNTPGRFIIPIFVDGNLEELIQMLIGEFRWELCKTMQGVYWNDISLKSLTSEYMDYLQFFKKNRDISEEGKEKIKQQIKKYRNISRDVFVSDYLVWINYESNGTTRLNKFTRDILYKYCPFSKDIRAKLSSHPSFSSAASHFENVRAKHAKDLEARYARYTRDGIVLDQEMVDTLDFYKNY